MSSIIYHPKAIEDISDAQDWYDFQDSGFGNFFENDVYLTIDKLLSYPKTRQIIFDNNKAVWS